MQDYFITQMDEAANNSCLDSSAVKKQTKNLKRDYNQTEWTLL